jgi:hypothetical protein
VAACYFVKGRGYELLNRPAEAQVAYEGARQLPDARVWDPGGDTFWSPAVAAVDQLARLSLPSVQPTWFVYTENIGSRIAISAVPDRPDAIQLSFDVRPSGWAGISKDIKPELLANTGKIRFSYKGDGARNTLELKLLYGPDSGNRMAVFSTLWPAATTTSDWVAVEVPYSRLTCWPDTGCRTGDKLDLRRVRKIDFAISNKLGDTPGLGSVTLGGIEAVK